MGSGAPLPLNSQEARREIELDFPALKIEPYTISSEKDQDYNCVSWSLNDTQRYWWPAPRGSGCYWPPDVPNDERIETFILLFEDLYFEKCESVEPEPGFDKVAIYAIDGLATHVARLWLEDATWTSKLGENQDIQHHTLLALEGDQYGKIAQILKRKRR